jgi:hypothetical protein
MYSFGSPKELYQEGELCLVRQRVVSFELPPLSLSGVAECFRAGSHIPAVHSKEVVFCSSEKDTVFSLPTLLVATTSTTTTS